MSLQRKENNLRKAQARLDRIQNPPRWKVISRMRSREFQIDFRREQGKSGRYKTRAYIVRGERSYHGGKGVIHKAANLKYRIKGDVPSISRSINNSKPKTWKGKVLRKSAQAVNFAVNDTAQTVLDVSLAAETIGINSADMLGREIKNKLKQEYTREAIDDYHRGAFFIGKTAADAVSGTRNHFKQKKQHKLEKAKYKLKEADNKLYKAKTFDTKLKADKAALKKAKAEYKSKKANKKFKYYKAKNFRLKQKYLQEKRELKFDESKIKTEYKFRKKQLKNQRKISRDSGQIFLALKPVVYSAKRMRASAWQKAVNEDQENDILHAIDSAKRRIAEPVKEKFKKSQRLQREEKKRDRLKDSESKSKNRLNRQENKLNRNRDDFKKNKKRKNKKAKKSFSKKIISAFNFIKNIYEKEVKKFFAALAVPVVIILLVFAFIVMIFSSIMSGGGFTLGTYAAQDYDLSEAEKYYTKLAWEMNESILKISGKDDWKDGLSDFGAKKKDLKDKPDNWYWGRSDEYDWDPVYDFDCYKLWSFLCAYYYDFSVKNGDIKYWKFDSDTEKVIEEIFNAEYEFVYWYDNKSRWEDLDSYVYFGGGNSENGSYYYCEQNAFKNSDAAWTYKFRPTSYTSELGQYLDDDGYCYLNSNYRVLDANDDYSFTGYYVLDNRYFADSSHTKEPFYWVDEKGKYFFKKHDGNDQYRTFYGWDSDDAWFMITEDDAKAWTGDDDCSALFGYVQKQYWKTECNLYYNVKQKKTFDEVIEEKLKSMSYSEERTAYYDLLVGNEDGNTLYGNHQTLHNILPGDTVKDYSLKRQFGYEMNDWNAENDGLYQGIKVYCTSGEFLYAPFDCEIKSVDEDEKKITLRKDDTMYWYDGSGGTKRDTEVEIANAALLSGFSKGDTLKEGQKFAKTTSGNVNFHINIDTDGYGWDYVDPRLVLY